jgi:gas vesicle protein
MSTNGESKFSYLFIGLGLGLGAIAGLMFALLARKETRELLRERSSKTLDYLNQHAGKLRESAEAVVEKGRKFMGHQCDAVDTHTEAEAQAYHEERRETLGG